MLKCFLSNIQRRYCAKNILTYGIERQRQVKNMVFFITVLRALAACLITNAHYTGIYPTDLIANGGLIGDVIFFAVSGYCLYHVKSSFPKWYGKRIYRVYVPVWVVTAVFLLLGCHTLAEHSLAYYFVYPTDYHFVASIVLLYIPFYILMRLEFLQKRIPLVMLALAAVMMTVYVCFYDTSYYHVDTVREPFIRFLFMESMLLGAYFKHHDARFRNRFSWLWVILTVPCFVIYFASKLLFSKLDALSDFQIVNQLLIFALLFCIFRVFSGLDGKLEKLPRPIRRCISFIAQITLEIYVVQYVLIDTLRPLFGFPINWLVITGAIILSAFALHFVCGLFSRLVDKIFMKKDSTIR